MTSSVNLYHIPSKYIKAKVAHGDTQCCINIIDSPGFGDTRGEEMDKKINYMIRATLLKMKTLDYLLMVIKSTENRLALT